MRIGECVQETAVRLRAEEEERGAGGKRGAVVLLIVDPILDGYATPFDCGRLAEVLLERAIGRDNAGLEACKTEVGHEGSAGKEGAQVARERAPIVAEPCFAMTSHWCELSASSVRSTRAREGDSPDRTRCAAVDSGAGDRLATRSASSASGSKSSRRVSTGISTGGSSAGSKGRTALSLSGKRERAEAV